jgi:O-antigen/teichoic acid export membrane protein
VSSSTRQSGEWTRVLRNGAVNLAGSLVPLLVGVLSIPVTIRGIGVDAFGVLSFAWAVLGYFTLFDLGLSRATTKLMADMIGRRVLERLPALVWTSVVLSAALGVAGGVTIAVLSNPLLGHVLKIAPTLATDARRSFLLLGFGLPAVLVSNTFKGALEADQQFVLVNLVKIPASAAMFALPALGVALGFGLTGIVWMLVLSRFAAVIAYGASCAAVFPALRRGRFDKAELRPLLTYGGWVTISNVLGPVLTYADRFVIGAMLSTAAVAYYTAPYEIVTRLWIVPASMVTALFPAFSASAARHGHSAIGRYCRPSIKYLLIIITPIVVVLALFAHSILSFWLGKDFADRGTTVFQVLAVGVLLNSLTQVPFTLLQALERADLPAKFYVIELALYVPFVAFLVSRMGIVGAAWAWTARVGLDCLLHFGASWKFYPAAWMSSKPPMKPFSGAYNINAE